MIRIWHVDRYLRHVHIRKSDILTVIQSAECSVKIITSIVPYPTGSGVRIIQAVGLKNIARPAWITHAQMAPITRLSQVKTVPTSISNKVMNRYLCQTTLAIFAPPNLSLTCWMNRLAWRYGSRMSATGDKEKTNG